MKKSKVVYIILLALVIMAVLYLMIRPLYNDNKLSSLRSEYEQSIPKLQNSIESMDYIKSVSIDTSFSLKKIDDKHGTFNDDIQITITLEDSYNNYTPRQQCAIICQLDEQILRIFKNNYEDSEYYMYFLNHRTSEYVDILKYQGMSVLISEDSDRDYYCKGTSYGIISNVFCVNPVPHSNEGEELYDYFYINRELKSFDPHGLKGLSDTTTAPAPRATKNNRKSSSAKDYDLYDVQKYNSAQEFADDKYEEFYDYEGDFEDEDEAYDAAEDYWNENHE